MFKIFALTVTLVLFAADARRIDKVFSEYLKSHAVKRYQEQQLCHEQVVITTVYPKIYLNKDGKFHPDKINSFKCKHDRAKPLSISDSSVICKSKTRQAKVLEADGNGKLINIHYIPVGSDCVAYKV
ncbi:uncharacterized protein LOC124440034 [Xenia sp. Carnegie-2017]|uniref:uncharacterized protein LOC124440034 n=1 Tax=Xenia sp. Carnegie-2017 TaxID=2897299 RepID=UPI001F04061F|nr:uncharacterized protein LOC124440034 [Xenia sp. Carnegie-2017]